MMHKWQIFRLLKRSYLRRSYKPNQKEDNMRRYVLIFGSIAGFVLVLMMFLTAPFLGEDVGYDTAEWLGYISMIVALSTILLASNHTGIKSRGAVSVLARLLRSGYLSRWSHPHFMSPAGCFISILPVQISWIPTMSTMLRKSEVAAILRLKFRQKLQTWKSGGNHTKTH